MCIPAIRKVIYLGYVAGHSVTRFSCHIALEDGDANIGTFAKELLCLIKLHGCHVLFQHSLKIPLSLDSFKCCTPYC